MHKNNVIFLLDSYVGYVPEIQLYSWDCLDHPKCAISQRKSVFQVMRSALTYLFERYDLEQDNYFFKNIGELIKGLTREVAKARQIWGSSI